MRPPALGKTAVELALRDCPVPACAGTLVTNRKLQRNFSNAQSEFFYHSRNRCPSACAQVLRVLLIALLFCQILGAFFPTAACPLPGDFLENSPPHTKYLVPAIFSVIPSAYLIIANFSGILQAKCQLSW